MGEIKSLSFDNRVKKPSYMFQVVPHSTFNFSWRKEITLEFFGISSIYFSLAVIWE